MKIARFMAVLLLSQCFFGSVFATRAGDEKAAPADRALVVMVHQVDFSRAAIARLAPGVPAATVRAMFKPLIDAEVMKVRAALAAIPVAHFSAMGELGGLFISLHPELKSLDSEDKMVEAWDRVRVTSIKKSAAPRYGDRIFDLTGALVNDERAVSGVFAKAFAVASVVDVVMMVHAGDANIAHLKSKIPAGKRLGIAFTEGCNSGTGPDYLIDDLGAEFSIGFGGPGTPASASPVKTFSFWAKIFEGADAPRAVAYANDAGNRIIREPAAATLIKMLAGTDSSDDVVKGTTMNLRAAPAAPAALAPAPAAVAAAWSCSLCTYENAAAIAACEMCDKPR